MLFQSELFQFKIVFIDNENYFLYNFNMNENSWVSKWSRDQIKAMLLEQFQSFWKTETGILREQLREVERAATSPHAVIISGLRRAGKSTLLAQMAHNLGEEAFYYLNFEDDRLLNFQADDINDLYQSLLEIFGERKIFMLDEIQNIAGWEHFVRRFMDMGFKFYITGSNALLLSRELGTRLTGRYIAIELFPFSFKEYLRFREIPLPPLDRMTTVDLAQLQKNLVEYSQSGGVPDALKYPELAILRTLYNDVLYRDIATRYRLGNVAMLKELGFFLMSNIANLISYNKLKQQFNVGSVNTIKTYIEYMQDSWLFFTLNVHDYSVKRQQIAAKKIYSIDTGLSRSVGFQFSPNTGRVLENLVFLALRQKNQEVYYLTTPNGYEVDFYLPEKGQLIQVSQHLENSTTREREIRALQDALAHTPAQTALILANANQDGFEINGIPVSIRSTAEWLLQE